MEYNSWILIDYCFVRNTSARKKWWNNDKRHFHNGDNQTLTKEVSEDIPTSNNRKSSKLTKNIIKVEHLKMILTFNFPLSLWHFSLESSQSSLVLLYVAHETWKSHLRWFFIILTKIGAMPSFSLLHSSLASYFQPFFHLSIFMS